MKTILLILSLFLVSCTAKKAENQTKSLFNGKDLSGWHADIPAMDINPDTLNPFIVRDSLLVSLGTPRGHLITDSVYQNYRLKVVYRFSGEAGNCGVLIHTSTPRILNNMFPQSLEVQMKSGDAGDFWCIMEDITVPDMVARRGPEETWGVTKDKNRRVMNLTDNSEKPIGEWNTMVVECVGNEIKVWMNNDMINQGYNCTASKGQIALQSEGSQVEFKSVEIIPITKISETAPE